MSVTSQTHPFGFQMFTLTSGDNEVEISSFGGQIVSWTKGEVPIVFANKDRAIVDGKTAYRGGAPICFPWFGPGSLLPLGTMLKPQHGQARITVWSSEIRGDSLVLSTKQPSGEGYGPTNFSLELVYTLSDKLTVEATISNVGEAEAPFQFAIHCYWATSEPSMAQVHGLGTRYLDNLLGLTEKQDSSVAHQTPFDRIYLDPSPNLELKTENYSLKIDTSGCSGAVLWNPGKDHTLKDLGSPDFICLESGLFYHGRNLDAGESFKVSVSYEAQTKLA